MSTIQEVRKTQDAQVERLRKLQFEKSIAPAERKGIIQKEIDAVEKDIRNLDTVIQDLIRAARAK